MATFPETLATSLIKPQPKLELRHISAASATQSYLLHIAYSANLFFCEVFTFHMYSFSRLATRPFACLGSTPYFK